MGREAVLLERFCKQKLEAKQVGRFEWLETRAAAMRSEWQLTGFTSCVRGNPAWFILPAPRVLVLYPERPECELADLLEPSNPFTGEKWVGQIAIP
jgi:hypothetical protein